MSSPQKTVVHTCHEKNFIEIIDQGGMRSLNFQDEVVQSRMSLQLPHRLILKYTQYMMAAVLLANPAPQQILLIGIGAGALLHFFHHHFPESTIDAVDYSEQVINVARVYFSLPENENITVHCADGLDYLSGKEVRAGYDLILFDAFNDRGMAPTIYSSECFRLARQKLAPDGIICCNLWSGKRDVYDSVGKAIRKNAAASLFIPVNKRENVIALLFQTPVPWRQFCPADTVLEQLTSRYLCNFKEVTESAKRKNLKLAERLQLWAQLI